MISTTTRQQVHQNNESTYDTSRRKALTSITTGILPFVVQPFVANGATLETNTLPTTGSSTDGRVLSTPPIPGMSPKLISQIIADESWSFPTFLTQLAKSRISVSELSALSPSLIPFAADNELYYGDFLFGSWDATATLKRKEYPLSMKQDML